MANKWKTSIADADWVFDGYQINPADPLTETIRRKVKGIDKSVLASLIATLKTTTSVEDPVIDNQEYEGTWTVKTLDPVADTGGNTSDSAEITQILSKGSYAHATPDNISNYRNRAYPLEQNENAWMYYERFRNEDTKKWSNLTYAGLNADVYDAIRQIRTSAQLAAAIGASGDNIPGLPGSYYYHRRFLYSIVYIEASGPTDLGVSFPALPNVPGNYYRPSNIQWGPLTVDPTKTEWQFNQWEQITKPVIREAWHEQNQDGTYNIYRSLETTSEPAIMRTRALQYAGMILVSGLPILDDTTITLSGFNYATETIYENARFRIGGDIYRVTEDATCAGGAVTLNNITPAITQATEDACDANPNQVQVFFEAL